jgi:hypothetical protein
MKIKRARAGTRVALLLTFPHLAVMAHEHSQNFVTTEILQHRDDDDDW